MLLPRIAVPDSIDPACFAGFEADAPVITLAGETMGTRWQVRLAHRRGAPAPAQLQHGIAQRLEQLCREMSHWDPASRLMAFNRAAPGTWCTLPADFAQVLDLGLAVARASHGAFDPAIGRLTDAWSLGPNRHASAPDTETLLTARCAGGWQKLAFTTPHLRQPGGLWLDLSGIAKGHAADALADLLAGLGLAHALVEVGGECAGRGLRPDGDPWWVDLESPPGLALAPLRLALHQLSLATSGAYLGQHTLDPRSGLPSHSGTLAASVIHPRCALADAWASALLVAPWPEAQALARRHALPARLIDGAGREWLSPALEAMLAQD